MTVNPFEQPPSRCPPWLPCMSFPTIGNIVIVLIVLAITSPIAHAGGVIANALVLDDRAVQTRTLCDGNFEIESRRLVDPVLPMHKSLEGKLKDSESWDSDAGYVRRLVMKNVLTPAHYRLTREAESRQTPDDVLTIAQPLDSSLRHYLAGAVVFRQSQFDEAGRLFRLASKSKATAKQPWPLLARFMVARCAEESGDITAAIKVYRKVIADAQAGQADPTSIALSSLGALGRIHGRRGEWKESVLAYAQEAASGAPIAPNSLQWAAVRLVEDPTRLRTAVRDPLVLNLMVLFAFTHFAEGASLSADRPVLFSVAWNVDDDKPP